MEKPTFLYHGSPRGDVEVFEPRVSGGSGEKYGALVYATPDKTTASIFMLRIDGEWSAGRFGDVPYIVVKQPRDEVLKNDKGGYLYVLPSDSFSSDPTRGLGDYEWASKEKIRPIQKIEYPSALDAVLEQGVQVYFTDEETYKKIKESDDHGLSVLKKLESENQKRGMNVRTLDTSTKGAAQR